MTATMTTRLSILVRAGLCGVALVACLPAAHAQRATPAPPLRAGFNQPPAGETRFLTTEMIIDIPASVTIQALDAIAARHTMTRLESRTFPLMGRTLHRWRLDGGGTVEAMIRGLNGEPQIAGAQPNYLYDLMQAEPATAPPAANAPAESDQYAAAKLRIPEAHRLATGSGVLVAMIDSGVDDLHPELAGAVTASFDAASDGPKAHVHGTGMAGAIAARGNLMGSAPKARLLTVRAFGPHSAGAQGTTFDIVKGLDWAAERGARIVNMSFAGPPDPRLHDALARASRKGMVLIAAAGNAGANSPPLYPAADPNVIAVTAVDPENRLFSGANRGNHIAVAAPGVAVLAAAPEGAYQFTTGTSVAAAEVSGVAALLIERNPALTGADVRRLLRDTATDLGPKGRDRDFGAGLVDAFRAVTAARAR
jgi:subtilisin family serine protease